jgi:phage N-6-adenine-methyltransferase
LPARCEILDRAVEQQIADQQNFVDWWYGVPSDPEKPRHVRSQGEARKEIPDQRFLSVEAAEAEGGITSQKVSKFRARLLSDRPAYEDLLRGPSWRKALMEKGSSDQKGASGTGENEYFTPIEHIKRARAVLGEIDLDPATHPEAQEQIRAKTFFTKRDNGLDKQWHGRVWLNPPYAQPLISQFVQKLVDEYQAGRVTAAILLTHNYTDTAWFQEAAGCASALCFTRGRVRFYEPNGTIAAPTQGQAFFYFGSDIDSFAKCFRSVGFIVTPFD